jgi:hypothetical protein
MALFWCLDKVKPIFVYLLRPFCCGSEYFHTAVFYICTIGQWLIFSCYPTRISPKIMRRCYETFHPTALLGAMFIDFSVALSSVTFRKWRCCSTRRKWRLVQTPVTSNLLYQSLWRMSEGDSRKRSQATAEGVYGRSCRLQHTQTWRRGSPHSAQTDANVERVKCDCGRYTGTASFQTGFTATGRAGKLRIHPV